MTETGFFLYIWLIIQPDFEKGCRKYQVSQFCCCLHQFLHTDTHLITSHTGKEEILLSKQHFKHFETVIFSLFCTSNTSDIILLGLFPLLLAAMLSEPHHIHEKKKLNYRRNEHSKDLRECYCFLNYTPTPKSLFVTLFMNFPQPSLILFE